MSSNIIVFIIAVLAGFSAVAFNMWLIQERDKLKQAEITRLLKENQECREHVDILNGDLFNLYKRIGLEEGVNASDLYRAKLRKEIRELEALEMDEPKRIDEPPQADWVDDGKGDE